MDRYKLSLSLYSSGVKVFIKPYSLIAISGSDLGVKENIKRRITFSPDDIHSLFIDNNGEDLIISNNSDVNFEFTISRGNRTMAIVEYKPSIGLVVNSQWRIKNNLVRNRVAPEFPEIQKSRILNFEIDVIGTGRVDLKHDREEYAALLFDHRKLYSVRFNGDYAIKHFDLFIERERDRRPLNIDQVKEYLNNNPQMKLGMIRSFIIDWVRSIRNHEVDPEGIIRNFISGIGLDRSIE